jgi:hypothetical protein
LYNGPMNPEERLKGLEARERIPVGHYSSSISPSGSPSVRVKKRVESREAPYRTT